MDDHQLAAWLAEKAGQILLASRNNRLDPIALGYVADQTANAFLIAALKMLRPDDCVLSEEAADDSARLGAERVWIVDPLDGTREYVEGRGDWAVHVALSIGGRPAVGAVAVPAHDRVFHTGDVGPSPRRDGQQIMLVSRSRPPGNAEDLARALGAEPREMGSAGAKAAAVIAGDADIYYHAGGQHEWDNCAPVAVALAAGLVACRADGSPICYNQSDTRVPDLVIARPEIGRRAVELLAGMGQPDQR